MFEEYKTCFFKINYLKILPLNLILFFILPLVACPSWGQVVQKKELTVSDHKLWGALRIDKISADEKWISYNLTYENNIDTLFVRSTENGKTYSFPAVESSFFMQSGRFAFYRNDSLQIVNLNNGKIQNIDKVSRYAYSEPLNLLLLLMTSKENKKMLRIQSPSGNLLREIENVAEFSLSPDGSKMVYNEQKNFQNSVFVSDLQKINSSKFLIHHSVNFYDQFVWHRSGKAVAFYSMNNDGSIASLLYYNYETQDICELNIEQQLKTSQAVSIVHDPINKVMISDDLQKVFFSVKYKTSLAVDIPDSDVEIWNANDKWIFAQEQNSGKLEQQPKVAIWFVMQNQFQTLATNDLPKIMLSGDQKYAVLSNPKAYEPQFDFEGPRDYYILNIDSGEKELFLAKQSSFYKNIILSPNGKYIAYFKDHNWWIYNFENKTHTNITHKISVPFFGKVHLLASDAAFGNPGWSEGDKEILLYDEFDIWAVKPDGSQARRLTKGKESKIQFRFAPVPNQRPLKFIYDGLSVNCFDLTKQLYLKASGDDGKSGYYKWEQDKGEAAIVYENSSIDELNYIPKKNAIFYLEQRFDLAPRIMKKDIKSDFKLVYQSNTQQNHFNWGKSELIEYQNSKNQALKGVLIYPADYDSAKKYPMVVSVYELQYKLLHQYVNPSFYNQGGFNETLFSTKGYFVFLPDIIHENENPGVSAADCVISGTKKVIDMGIVDADRIGILGHSFGGYESAFIISQTNLFKAAVASGGITDLTSFYLTVSSNTGIPDMWRFESEQWRMGKTPFEATESYARNSPISNVEKIVTPVLIWAGKQDEQVDSRQSVELYLALRRLGKKSIMLLYPAEGHSLQKPSNQKDVTQRVLQWFDYHLKDETSLKWISDGIK